jgi:hypothetical protein
MADLGDHDAAISAFTMAGMRTPEARAKETAIVRNIALKKRLLRVSADRERQDRRIVNSRIELS